MTLSLSELNKISRLTFQTNKDMNSIVKIFINIEDGWTHEDVCKNSYTDERLAWLFKHTKGQTTGITSSVNDDNKVVHVVWYSLNGQMIASEPVQKGIYIKNSFYSNGKSVTEKYCK